MKRTRSLTSVSTSLVIIAIRFSVWNTRPRRKDMVSLKRTLVFLLSYVIYLLLGSFMFKAFECPQEMAEKRALAKEEEEFMMLMDEALKKIKEEAVPLPEASLFYRIHQLSQLQSERRAPKKEIVCETWSMYNSMFFVFTSITTIGYGKVTPQTQLGRGACLVYCVIGIPTNSILICLVGNLFIKQERKTAKQIVRIKRIPKLLVTYV